MSGNLQGTLVLSINGEDQPFDVNGLNPEDTGRGVISDQGWSVTIHDDGGAFDAKAQRSVTIDEPEVDDEGLTVEVLRDETDVVVTRPELYDSDDEDDENEDDDDE